MIDDMFRDPVVQAKMRDLQQQKYRQGHRNTTDTHGNPAYALTDDDKISCLDPQNQQIVRSQQARLKKLEAYAAPFDFTLGIGEIPPSYVLNIRHPGLGDYARRTGSVAIVDSMKDPDSWFRQQIDEMTAELGYTKFIKDFPKSDDEVGKYLKMQEEKRQVADVAKKQRHLVCPDHGNEMVRGEEPGTLVCIVIGCKRVARKKQRSDAVVGKTEPEAAPEYQQVDPEIVDALKNMKKLFGSGGSMPVFSVLVPDQAVGVQFTDRTTKISALAPTVYIQNNSVPKIVRKGNRWYLVQQITPGREAYIDITPAAPHVDQRTSGPGGFMVTTVTLKNVRPG